MNKKIQNVGLLAIVTVFAITLTVGNAGLAAATNIGGPDVLPRSASSQYKVCGDHLCHPGPVQHVAKISKVSEKPLPEHVPTIQAVEAYHFDAGSAPHAYIAVFKVTAGDANLSNIQILIQSDIDQFDTNLGSLFAGDDTDLVTHVHALDPTTITARVASYQVRDAGR